MDAFRGSYPETIMGLYAHVQIRHGVDLPEYTLVPERGAPTTQKHHHHTRVYVYHLLHTHLAAGQGRSTSNHAAHVFDALRSPVRW